jgi:pyruvate formate lyase activating enzyme
MMQPGNRDPAKCVKCFTCVGYCPSGALQHFGLPLSLEAVIEDLRHDFSLFRMSGGGVTLSGGEPTLYPNFTAELARRLHKEEIHTAVETSGAFHWDKARPLLEEIDLVLFDIKLFDDYAHRQLCGGSNTVIKENLQKLKEMNRHNSRPSIWPRMPLVPSITDRVENLHAWAQFLRQNEIYQMTIVPYHRLGDVKRLWLGIMPAPEILAPSPEDLEAAIKIFSEEGIVACVPGEEKIPPDPSL